MEKTKRQKFRPLSLKEMRCIVGGKWVFLREVPTNYKCLERDEYGNCIHEVVETVRVYVEVDHHGNLTGKQKERPDL